MGMADSFGRDDRAEIKTAELIKLVRSATKGKMLLNAVNAGIPLEQVSRIITFENETLNEYLKTELTPDQIREMDHLYAEKCKDVAVLTAEKEMLKKQLDDLRTCRREEGEADKATQEGMT